MRSPLELAAFVTALFGHPFVLAAVAGLLGYLFGEKWQRWRQRRDFQYRAMTTLASISGEVLSVLYEMLALHQHAYYTKRHRKLLRGYGAKMALLLALDADFFATFEAELMPDFNYLTGVMNAAHQILAASGPIPVAHAWAVLKCATAQRRLLIAKMSQEMDLGAKAAKDLIQRLERRARDLPAGVTIPAPEEA